jgi:hypothetical protein
MFAIWVPFYMLSGILFFALPILAANSVIASL